MTSTPASSRPRTPAPAHDLLGYATRRFDGSPVVGAPLSLALDVVPTAHLPRHGRDGATADDRMAYERSQRLAAKTLGEEMAVGRIWVRRRAADGCRRNWNTGSREKLACR
jgi:hypothetical protein